MVERSSNRYGELDGVISGRCLIIGSCRELDTLQRELDIDSNGVDDGKATISDGKSGSLFFIGIRCHSSRFHYLSSSSSSS